jgi:hypothetical protein
MGGGGARGTGDTGGSFMQSTMGGMSYMRDGSMVRGSHGGAGTHGASMASWAQQSSMGFAPVPGETVTVQWHILWECVNSWTCLQQRHTCASCRRCTVQSMLMADVDGYNPSSFQHSGCSYS